MHPITSAALGGALIGLSATLLFLFNGRTAGISSIAGGLLSQARGEIGWRVAFLGGLVAGGIALAIVSPSVFGSTSAPSPRLSLVILGGLLVGFGTQLGGGCTSGHGVCGIGRGAVRSLVATALFIATGAIGVLLVRALLGGVTP